METSNLYFSYDDKVWRMKYPESLAGVAERTFYEVGEGEWFFAHEKEFGSGTHMFKEEAYGVRLKLQANGTLAVEMWK